MERNGRRQIEIISRYYPGRAEENCEQFQVSKVCVPPEIATQHFRNVEHNNFIFIQMLKGVKMICHTCRGDYRRDFGLDVWIY
jgi:hypothetical protein